MRTSIISIAALLGVCLTGCATTKPIGPTVDTSQVKERKYKEAKYETGLAPVASGSLWPENGRGLFADFRAYRVGDLVTINIDESSQANGDSNTNLDHESSESMGVPNFFGLTAAVAKAYPNLQADKLIEFMGQSSFKGQGDTSRDTHVVGSIAARAKKVLPNGDLFVEGTKVILINNEEVHIYVSGSIRSEDIDSTNAVSSSDIADAQIEFSGRGVLTDNQQQGWFTKLFQKIRPF